MRLAGCNAVPLRDGICQRRHEKRQGAKAPGPLCPDTLAANIVQLSLEAMAAFLNGVVSALAQAKVCAQQVTGIVAGTDLETTARSEGCGQATRQRQRTDKRGKVHEIAVTVSGWKLLVMIAVRTKIPLAAKVVQIQDHEASFTRALVSQAQTHLARHACLRRVVFDRGFLDGADLWWLAQQGLGFVVPAKENMRVTADAQALAAAGTGVVARRVHTVAHGQGKQRWRERLETAVVGVTALTTSLNLSRFVGGQSGQNTRQIPPSWLCSRWPGLMRPARSARPARTHCAAENCAGTERTRHIPAGWFCSRRETLADTA
jgi:hypothetical protein